MRPGVFSLFDFALNWCFPKCRIPFHSRLLCGGWDPKSRRSTMTKRPLGLPQGSFTIRPEKPNTKYPSPAAAAGGRVGFRAVAFLGGGLNSAEVNSVASG